ncbi:hypothetical protein [Rosistilla oblonga]|uniref:hypothetical protein n=1 Tax=Rosistilla oblonga TaxID=2527990 RepID=UPI003A96FB69
MNAGSILPFLQSSALRNYLQEELDAFKDLKVDEINFLSRLRGSSGGPGSETYQEAVEEFDRMAEARDAEFVKRVIEMSNHSDLRLFVMVFVQTYREKSPDHPFCQAYWKLSDADVAELQRIQRAREPVEARMQAVFARERKAGKAIEEIKELMDPEDVRKTMQSIGASFNLLDPQQLGEFLKFSGQVKPNESEYDYLARMPPRSRQALLSVCIPLKQAWEEGP